MFAMFANNVPLHIKFGVVILSGHLVDMAISVLKYVISIYLSYAVWIDKGFFLKMSLLTLTMDGPYQYTIWDPSFSFRL